MENRAEKLEMADQKVFRSLNTFLETYMPKELEKQKGLLEAGKCPTCQQILPPCHPLRLKKTLKEIIKEKNLENSICIARYEIEEDR